MVSGGEHDELRRLREENDRLKELLTQHGIWRLFCARSTHPPIDSNGIMTSVNRNLIESLKKFYYKHKN